MNIDFSGPAFEIAIALAFVFFLLSLLVTAVTELISGVSNLRAKTLRKGLEGMIGDTGIVNALFQHPLVRTDLDRPPNKRRDPSYLSPTNFARAFESVFDPDSPVSSDLSKQLKAINAGTLPSRAELEAWFDSGMERVSGAYKRWSQKIGLLIAAVVTIALNVSALQIAERLESDPTVRAAVVTKAEATAAAGAEKPKDVEAGAGEIKQAGEAADKALDGLEELKLPIFWGTQNLPHWSSPTEIGIWVLGWAVTIIAISLGAPFWFDALGRLSNLRSTGKRPEDSPATT